MPHFFIVVFTSFSFHISLPFVLWPHGGGFSVLIKPSDSECAVRGRKTYVLHILPCLHRASHSVYTERPPPGAQAPPARSYRQPPPPTPPPPPPRERRGRGHLIYLPSPPSPLQQTPLLNSPASLRPGSPSSSSPLLSSSSTLLYSSLPLLSSPSLFLSFSSTLLLYSPILLSSSPLPSSSLPLLFSSPLLLSRLAVDLCA